MGWLNEIIKRGSRLRLKELGYERELPENPTLDDIKKEAFSIGQLAKEVQNTKHHWSDEQWREISKAIENLEKK